MMDRRIGPILVAFCFVSTLPVKAQGELWGGLEEGEYQVGFTAKWVVDENRKYQEHDTLKLGTNGRPIRLMIWYPTETDGPKMSLGDFIHSVKPEHRRFERIARLLEVRETQTMNKQFSAPNKDSLAAMVKTLATKSQKHAEIFPGKFPLLIYSLGLNDFQQESIVLWEYLASNGYIVVVLPQIGLDLYQMSTGFSDLVVRAYQMDMSFVLDHFKQNERWSQSMDFARLGLIGHSLGGAVGLAFANERDVSGIAMLDGAIHDSQSREVLDRIDWNYDRFDFQLLNLYPGYRIGMTELSLFDSLKNVKSYHVQFSQATHFDFQQWPVYSVVTGVSDARGERFRSAEDGLDVYYKACQLVLDFCNHAVAGKTTALDYLANLKTFQSDSSMSIFFDEDER